MGYMTNQWLLGDWIRDSSWRPVGVSLNVAEGEGEWDARNEVRVRITMTQKSGEPREDDFQMLLLTDPDIQQLLPLLLRLASEEVRRDAAVSALSGLSDPELLATLQTIFARRSASQKT